MADLLLHALLLPVSAGVCAGYWLYRLEQHLTARPLRTRPKTQELSSL